MGPTIFELWVMETENWVVETPCPNRPLVVTHWNGVGLKELDQVFGERVCGWRFKKFIGPIFSLPKEAYLVIYQDL